MVSLRGYLAWREEGLGERHALGMSWWSGPEVMAIAGEEFMSLLPEWLPAARCT